MRRIFFVFLVLTVSFNLFGQVVYENENLNSSYISSIVLKVDSLIEDESTDLIIEHSDGDFGSSTYCDIGKKTIREDLNEFMKGGLLTTVRYFNPDNSDCLIVIKFSKKGTLKFEYHLIRIDENIYEESVKGKKEKFNTRIEKRREELINDH